MTCRPSMYAAFKAVMAAPDADNETYADLCKNAIEAAMDAQAPWDRFLEARTACLHAFVKEGKTMEQIAVELSFHDVDHAKRVYAATIGDHQ